ncbi:hypothetical protein [Syntrophomonas wolfei]|uniref:CRISPR-associated protein, Csh1 family n=1 Tax=Syntrophomonas wolfei subsp. wolfei (strain DSM 2245B / Goettingen) TaxID=335541 RepID=Q0AVZ8_SYNWW|nr:hypothetical protein [Syntrophomonas wolfei]ABI69106.1 hypothetical protein Swol_1808 [Syntrophomonas wolfei subsp. wolfei str. Goettingen G311]
MLKDLLNEFVNHPDFDVDTMVLDNYQLEPGLYIRFNNYNKMDELYVKKNTDLPENDPLVKWFKKADFYSSLIEMNKPVDPKKKIHSNNLFTLFCKRDIFYQEGKVHPELQEHIDRYFSALLNPGNRETAKILAAAHYEPLPEESVYCSKARFNAVLDTVAEYIKKEDIRNNCYIKLFLNAEEEAYVYESGRYLLPKIFNKNTYNINVGGRILGLSNTDMGMNAKKPFLEHKTTAFKVPYRISTEEALLLRKFYLWLFGQGRGGRPLYNGYIPVWEHAPQLLLVANEVDVRKPVIYLHFERGVDLTIDDCEFLPSFSDKMSKAIVFTNYFDNCLDKSSYKSGVLDKLSAVEAHINENLYAFQLVSNYDVKNIKVTEKLSQALANQIMLSREAMRAWLRKGYFLPMQSGVDKITMGVILARLQKLEFIPALAYALNVRFSLMKYFREEEKDMGLTIQTAYLNLREKVLNTKDTASCENDLEFYLAVGQLLRYFFSLSQAQTLHYDVLWRGITAARDAGDIKTEYRKYFQRYAHEININNPRFNNMLSIASSYLPKKEEPINLDALFYGFAADKIIYYKDKEDDKNDKEQ